MKQCRFFILLALLIGDAQARYAVAAADEKAISRTVQRVPAGVVINQNDSSQWNRVVMIAKPRIASGDIGALPEFIQKTVSKFVLTILATVEERPDSGNEPRQPRFRLVEIGVGHSVQVAEKLVVVSPDDYQRHGVHLSFLERQILSQNQRQFGDIRTVVRTSTLMMFDVPSLLVQEGEHRSFIMRHLVWVDGKTGKLSTLIWLLQNRQWGDKDRDEEETFTGQVVETEPIRWWDSSRLEDRAIHVDKKEFTLGIPGARAFALEAMPAGVAINWNEAARKVGGLSSYSKEDLQALMEALSTVNPNYDLGPPKSGNP